MNLTSIIDEKIRENKNCIKGLENETGVKCLSATRNIQGSVDIELDKNIYYKEQAKMEKEIRDTLFLTPINDIYYQDIV